MSHATQIDVDYDCGPLRAVFRDVGLERPQAISRWYHDVTRSFIEAVVRPGDHVIDAGAYDGTHSFAMAEAVGADGRVYAIEPVGATRHRLDEAIERHPDRRVAETIWLLPHAVADVDARAELVVTTAEPARSGLRSHDAEADFGPLALEDVAVHRLDSVITEPGRVTFIKLDLAGAELLALRGAVRILAEGRPCLAFKGGGRRYMQRFGFTCEEFFAFFESQGYVVLTPFGAPFTRQWLTGLQPHQLFAVPAERAGLIWEAVLPAALRTLPRMGAAVGGDPLDETAALPVEQPVASQQPEAAVESIWPAVRLLLEREPDELVSQFDAELQEGLLVSRSFQVEWASDRTGPAWRLRQAVVRRLLKRRRDRHPLNVRLEDGCVLRLDPWKDKGLARDLLLHGEGDREVGRYLQACLGPGDCALVVGAGYGHAALVASRAVRPGGHVVAVEDDPLLAGWLRDAPRTNRADNLELAQCVLGESDRDAGPASTADAAAEIAIRSLDGLAVGLGRSVDLLLLEGAGSRVSALRGAARLMAGELGPPPVILVRAGEGTAEGDPERAMLLLAEQAGYEIEAEAGPEVSGEATAPGLLMLVPSGAWRGPAPGTS